MRIGILGSGLMGGKLGTLFARAGHEVVFSYSWSERKLKRLAREALGHARAGTPREAALNADALLLAVHWSRVDEVLKQAGDLSGKVIVTCSLPMNADDTRLVIAHTSSGAEALAKKVRKADVVSAFSTIPSEVLFDVFDAKRRTRRRPSLVYCGDDQHAKDVAELWRITTSASRAIIHPLYLAAGPPITSLAHVDPSEARRGVGGAVTLARAPRKT